MIKKKRRRKSLASLDKTDKLRDGQGRGMNGRQQPLVLNFKLKTDSLNVYGKNFGFGLDESTARRRPPRNAQLFLKI